MLKRTILLIFLALRLFTSFSQTLIACCEFSFGDTIRVCEGTNVFISIKGRLRDSSTIKWRGPNFSSTESSFLIQNISTAQSGYYEANIQCPSLNFPGAFDGCGQSHLILVSPTEHDTLTGAVCPSHPYILSNGSAIATPGTYYDTLKTAIGCDSIVTILLKNVRSKDTLQAAICPGESHRLPDGRMANTAGIYTSILKAQNGCDSLVYTQVQQVAGNIGATVPNTFTPNGDGVNDVFRIINLPPQRFVSLQVYNRWSQLVFNTRLATAFWKGTYNGKPQPSGVFVYLLQYINCVGRLQQSKGTINLMR